MVNKNNINLWWYRLKLSAFSNRFTASYSGLDLDAHTGIKLSLHLSSSWSNTVKIFYFGNQSTIHDDNTLYKYICMMYLLVNLLTLFIVKQQCRRTFSHLPGRLSTPHNVLYSPCWAQNTIRNQLLCGESVSWIALGGMPIQSLNSTW